MFADSLEVPGFQGNGSGLRPSTKHKEKITKWPVPSNRAELGAFLCLTPFLRIFIPGRAQLEMEMKKAYLEQVPDEPKWKPPHDDTTEECDQDFTKRKRSSKIPKQTIRKKWVEKEKFE